MTIPMPRIYGEAEGDGRAEVAAEDLDLALSRLRWAESATCLRTAEQTAALQWLAAQVAALD
jgi:hypothetical protein